MGELGAVHYQSREEPFCTTGELTALTAVSLAAAGVIALAGWKYFNLRALPCTVRTTLLAFVAPSGVVALRCLNQTPVELPTKKETFGYFVAERPALGTDQRWLRRGSEFAYTRVQTATGYKGGFPESWGKSHMAGPPLYVAGQLFSFDSEGDFERFAIRFIDAVRGLKVEVEDDEVLIRQALLMTHGEEVGGRGRAIIDQQLTPTGYCLVEDEDLPQMCRLSVGDDNQLMGTHVQVHGVQPSQRPGASAVGYVVVTTQVNGGTGGGTVSCSPLFKQMPALVAPSWESSVRMLYHGLVPRILTQPFRKVSICNGELKVPEEAFRIGADQRILFEGGSGEIGLIRHDGTEESLRKLYDQLSGFGVVDIGDALRLLAAGFAIAVVDEHEDLLLRRMGVDAADTILESARTLRTDEGALLIETQEMVEGTRGGKTVFLVIITEMNCGTGNATVTCQVVENRTQLPVRE